MKSVLKMAGYPYVIVGLDHSWMALVPMVQKDIYKLVHYGQSHNTRIGSVRYGNDVIALVHDWEMLTAHTRTRLLSYAMTYTESVSWKPGHYHLMQSPYREYFNTVLESTTGFPVEKDCPDDRGRVISNYVRVSDVPVYVCWFDMEAV